MHSSDDNRDDVLAAALLVPLPAMKEAESRFLHGVGEMQEKEHGRPMKEIRDQDDSASISTTIYDKQSMLAPQWGTDLRSLMARGYIGLWSARVYAAELLLIIERLHQMKLNHGNLRTNDILINEDGHLAYDGSFALDSVDEKEAAAPPEVHHHRGLSCCLADRLWRALGVRRKEKEVEVVDPLSSDLHTFGAIEFEMLCGTRLSGPGGSGANHLTCLEHSRHMSNNPTVLLTDVDPVARDFLQKLLSRKPGERLTIEELKEHPFFAELDWDTVANGKVEIPFTPSDDLQLPPGYPGGKPYMSSKLSHLDRRASKYSTMSRLSTSSTSTYVDHTMEDDAKIAFDRSSTWSGKSVGDAAETASVRERRYARRSVIDWFRWALGDP
ncbi:hypothetical protein EVG20_g6240 [Dentipellis fragilis]|uniref:non-specific serine/threonine protein kinase n=1 Tax=Dentipellis fragilis TaxID=205917 RepID=A0A4Y9YQ07_9AGAM|nr:hypothetical protein EVG20_g6240 [Dentipellis fragilis]